MHELAFCIKCLRLLADNGKYHDTGLWPCGLRSAQTALVTINLHRVRSPGTGIDLVCQPLSGLRPALTATLSNNSLPDRGVKVDVRALCRKSRSLTRLPLLYNKAPDRMRIPLPTVIVASVAGCAPSFDEISIDEIALRQAQLFSYAPSFNFIFGLCDD